MNDSELTMRIPRLYKRFHRKLMKYIEQASVTEENLLINEYLRAENLILNQMCRIRFGKIRLSREEKICLAKNFCSIFPFGDSLKDFQYCCSLYGILPKSPNQTTTLSSSLMQNGIDQSLK